MDKKLIDKIKSGETVLNITGGDVHMARKEYQEVFTLYNTLEIKQREQAFVLLEVNQTKNYCHIVGVYKSHQGVSDTISHIKTMCADNISHKILIFDLEE